MSHSGPGPIDVRSISVMEDKGGSMVEPGVVVTSISELRDLFFGKNPLLRYDLTVRGVTRRGAETKARAWARAKNPFNPSIIGVGNVRSVPDTKSEFYVTLNVRG